MSAEALTVRAALAGSSCPQLEFANLAGYLVGLSVYGHTSVSSRLH